ncbi:DUF21 domain-containing protein [Marinobacteraceae bacterium S3BR75-40.1]
MEVLVWLGILLCLSQSALLSGSNLAFFSVSKLKLEVEARNNRHAARVRALRRDGNFLLATILWGNVAVNVLLALLSDSVLAGIGAFLFSTVVITIFGEIMPQAYFSRHALKTGFYLAPVIRCYQIVLYPIAKLTALVLDRWLGAEAIPYFRERDIRSLLKMHMVSPHTDIDRVEGQGALNFLDLDDVPLQSEGEPLDPESIVTVAFKDGQPVFPQGENGVSADFLHRIDEPDKKWVVLIDQTGEPRLMLNVGPFLRTVFRNRGPVNPSRFCHRPIVVKNDAVFLGEILPRLKVNPTRYGDDVVDDDVILVWGNHKRIITGADVLGRLLRGIVRNEIAGDV